MLLDAAARQLVTTYLAQPRRPDFLNARLVASARKHLSDVAEKLGAAGLAPAIAAADPARESAAESLSAGEFRLAGLPHPLCQAAIRIDFRLLYPDFLWPEFRLVGECDGAVKYASREDLVAEKAREQELRDLGYGVVRWLAREVMLRPDIVVDRVTRALLAQGWAP